MQVSDSKKVEAVFSVHHHWLRRRRHRNRCRHHPRRDRACLSYISVFHHLHRQRRRRRHKYKAVEANDRKSFLPIDWKSQVEESLKAVESYRAVESYMAMEKCEAAEKPTAVETNDLTRCEVGVGRKGGHPCRTSYQVRNKPSRASSMMALSMLAAAAAAISTPSVLRGTYLLGILTTNRRRASAQNAPSQAVSRRRHLARSHAGEVPVGFPSIVASGGASNLRRV